MIGRTVRKKKSRTNKVDIASEHAILSDADMPTNISIRKRLVVRAFTLFSERGFHRVSLEDVAAAENVTKGCIYGYFASKQDLILATCNYFYQEWQEKAFQVISLGTTPKDSLERIIHFSVERCITDAKNRIFTTEICAFGLHNREVLNGWSQFAATTRDLFFGLASAAVLKGEMQIANVRQAVEWMYSTFQGIKIRAVIEPNFCDTNRLEQIVQFLMRQLELNYSECVDNTQH